MLPDIDEIENGDTIKIFEKRCKIKDIDEARKVVELIGGIFKGHYSATDIIFKSKKTDPEKGAGVIVLRMFEINNRQTKNFILTHKIAEWDDKIKTDKIVLKETFDSMEEATNFIIDHYGVWIEEDYMYSRKGWEYHLDKSNIFIEDIEKLGSTIEIESENKKELENLFKHLETIECFSEPVSEVMRKLLGKY